MAIIFLEILNVMGSYVGMFTSFNGHLRIPLSYNFQNVLRQLKIFYIAISSVTWHNVQLIIIYNWTTSKIFNF